MDGRHQASTSVDVKLGVGVGRRRPLTTGYLRSMMSDTIRIGLYLLIMAGEYRLFPTSLLLFYLSCMLVSCVDNLAVARNLCTSKKK